MSEGKAREEYTQTRAEFGVRAINTAKAVRSILEELVAGYRAINNITPPGHGTTSSGSGSTTSSSGTETEQDERKGFDPHDPWFLNDAFKALDELIKFTETKYI